MSHSPRNHSQHPKLRPPLKNYRKTTPFDSFSIRTRNIRSEDQHQRPTSDPTDELVRPSTYTKELDQNGGGDDSLNALLSSNYAQLGLDHFGKAKQRVRSGSPVGKSIKMPPPPDPNGSNRSECQIRSSPSPYEDQKDFLQAKQRLTNRSQIKNNMEIYFRKKELSAKYSSLRPLSAASVLDEAQVSNRYSNHHHQQRPSSTHHAYGAATAPKRPASQRTAKAKYPITVKRTSMGTRESTPNVEFDCEKACSVESCKLEAEKDVPTVQPLLKPTRKTVSKSRIDTYWSFKGGSPAQLCAAEDVPALVLKPPTKTTNTMAKTSKITTSITDLLSPRDGPYKGVRAFKTLPKIKAVAIPPSNRKRPTSKETSSQTEKVRQPNINLSDCQCISLNNNNNNTIETKNSDSNYHYSISKNDSSINLKISNQYLNANPYVVLAKDSETDSISMVTHPLERASHSSGVEVRRVAPPLNNIQCEQFTSMDEDDFISFDYEGVELDDSPDSPDSPAAIAVDASNALLEQSSRVLRMGKHGEARVKEIIDRLGYLLREDVRTIKGQASSSSIEELINVENLNVSRPSSATDKNVDSSCATLQGKLQPLQQQQPQQQPLRPAESIHFISAESEETFSFVDGPVEPLELPTLPTPDHEFKKTKKLPNPLLNLSTTTSIQTIAEPISSVSFKVKLSQKLLRDFNKKQQMEFVQFRRQVDRKDRVKRLGLTSIYGLLFMVMFTALSLPRLLCLTIN